MSPRKKEASRKLKEEHTHIAVRVEHWNIRADASINFTALDARYGIRSDEDDSLYQFDTQLEISGTSIWPASRAGEIYELTLYGDGSRSGGVSMSLKDVHERDEDGSPQYRTYRGQRYPVYGAPPGLALIDKIRGESRWTTWVPAAPRFVSDVLMMLGQDRQLYLALHERKLERKRWLQNLSIQTDDPAESE